MNNSQSVTYRYRNLLFLFVLAAGGMVSSEADAATVTLQDNYVGDNYGDGTYLDSDVDGTDDLYQVSKMDVTLTGTNLNVRVYTAFAGRNGDFNVSQKRRIFYGDLLLGSNWDPTGSSPYGGDDFSNTGTKWTYGLVLEGKYGAKNDGADAGYRYTGNENLAGTPGTGTRNFSITQCRSLLSR